MANPNWIAFPGVENMAQDADGRPTTQDLTPGKQLGTPLKKAFFDPIIRYLCDLRDAVDAGNAAAISGVLGLQAGESPGLGMRSDATGQPVFTDKANGQRKLVLLSQLTGMLSGTAGVPSGGSAGQALFSDANGQPQYTDGANGERALALQSALSGLATTTALNSAVQAEKQRAEAAEVAIFQTPAWVPLWCPFPTAPDGFLPADGRSFSASLCPQLAAAFPSLKLPDTRGLFFRSLDTTNSIDNYNPSGPGRTVLSVEDGSVIMSGGGVGLANTINVNSPEILSSLGQDVPFPANYSQWIGTAGDQQGFWVNTSQYPGSGAARPKNIAWLCVFRAA